MRLMDKLNIFWFYNFWMDQIKKIFQLNTVTYGIMHSLWYF